MWCRILGDDGKNGFVPPRVACQKYTNAHASWGAGLLIAETFEKGVLTLWKCDKQSSHWSIGALTVAPLEID